MKSLKMDPDAGGRLMQKIWQGSNTVEPPKVGINEDDCAVLAVKGAYSVISQDFLNSHPALLELDVGDYYDLARLSVKVTLSDLFSSGATPTSLLCGCQIPKDFTRDQFVQIARGLKTECEAHGVNLVGGDTKLAEHFSLITTGVGFVESESNLLLAKNCCEGDDLWVSGPTGGFAASTFGLKYLDMSTSWKEWATRTIKGASLPIQKTKALSQSPKCRAATDITDGLLKDLNHMALLSGVGYQVDLDRLPVSRRVEEMSRAANVPPWKLALASGGDFQILASAPVSSAELLRNVGFRKIGKIMPEREGGITCYKGEQIKLDALVGHSDNKGLSFADEIRESIMA